MTKEGPLDIVPASDEARAIISKQTISILEDWLERAKRGEIDEVVIVGRCNDGTSDILVKASGTMSLSQQLGCLELAKIHCLEDS